METVDLAPAVQLTRRADADSTVAVADDLLVRLHLKVGDQLKIGSKAFRIAAVVVNEPDRLSGNFAAGPRVLISQRGVGGERAAGAGESCGCSVFVQGAGSGEWERRCSDAAVADLKDAAGEAAAGGADDRTIARRIRR